MACKCVFKAATPFSVSVIVVTHRPALAPFSMSTNPADASLRAWGGQVAVGELRGGAQPHELLPSRLAKGGQNGQSAGIGDDRIKVHNAPIDTLTGKE